MFPPSPSLGAGEGPGVSQGGWLCSAEPRQGALCSFFFFDFNFFLFFWFKEKKQTIAALAVGSPLFTLCISPIFSLLPMSLCASNPLYIPQSFEKVGVVFSFLLSLPTFLHSEKKNY